MTETNGAVSRGMELDSLGDGKQPASQTDSEQTMLVTRQRRHSAKTADKLQKIVLIVSWISVLYLGVMGVVTFTLAIINSNSAAFAFALDALLDSCTSAAVIWRFTGASMILYSARKEKICCITLGVLFIVSFISIITRSSMSLASGIHPKKSQALWIITITNTFVCAAFVVIKGILAGKLHSVSIATDAVNSGIGFMLALSSVLGDFAYEIHNSVWYVDSVIGIICSLFLLGYGIWLIVYQLRFARYDESFD